MRNFREAPAYVTLWFVLLLSHQRGGLSFQSIVISVPTSQSMNRHRYGSSTLGIRTFNANNNNRKSSLKYANADIETLKIRDMQAELRDRGVSYADCFDRESMVCRLKEARAGKVATATATATATVERNTNTQTTTPEVVVDVEKILSDLRSKPIKDLKLECSRRNLRYATFLDKEDFVQAVWKDMKEVLNFSVSGALRPGKASEVTGEQLDQELAATSPDIKDIPILVDVYANWCGPCKMMAPELEKAAAELGKNARVAKLDSDKNPQWASKYKVAGLPTILVLQNGQVKARMEGAVMKEKLLALVQPFVKSP